MRFVWRTRISGEKQFTGFAYRVWISGKNLDQRKEAVYDIHLSNLDKWVELRSAKKAVYGIHLTDLEQWKAFE